MRNKYEPGSEVLIKARIELAMVYEDSVIYQCRIKSTNTIIDAKFKEKDILMELVDTSGEEVKK